MDFEKLKTVKIDGGKIWLNSALKQEAFGRTRLALSLEEKGKTAEFFDGGVKFSDFNFTGVEEDEFGNVCFTAQMENAKSFLEILDFEESEKKTMAAQKLFLALSKTYENKIDLRLSGAEGIIFADEKIIFLPGGLFEQCVLNCRDEENFKFIYKGLDSSEQLLFFRSVAAYKILTGKFPFSENDLTKRQSDIADENFVPVELYLPNLNKNLAAAINSGLKMQPSKKNISSRKEFSDSKNEKKRNENLKNAASFDFENFESEIKNLKFYDYDEKIRAQNESKRNAFLRKQKIKITARRFFRRNKNVILAFFATAIFAAWMANGFIRENRLLATTKGLDSTAAAALMYTFIHKADVPNLQEIAKGKYTKDLIFKVAGFYVTAKQREEQNAQDKSVTVGERFFYRKDSSSWMYGITNLKIDGKSFPAESEFLRRKDKPEPIKEENGKILKNGGKISHSAEYYLVHQDSNKIYAEKIAETVNLSWKGKRWIVEKVEGKSKPLYVDSKIFLDEYYALLESGISIKNAAAKMREKYEWIPDEKDLQKDAKNLAEKYGSVEAEKFLSE